MIQCCQYFISLFLMNWRSRDLTSRHHLTISCHDIISRSLARHHFVISRDVTSSSHVLMSRHHLVISCHVIVSCFKVYLKTNKEDRQLCSVFLSQKAVNNTELKRNDSLETTKYYFTKQETQLCK